MGSAELVAGGGFHRRRDVHRSFPVHVLVLYTREELMVARETACLLGGPSVSEGIRSGV
jgi:hypothetical protein